MGDGTIVEIWSYLGDLCADGGFLGRMVMLFWLKSGLERGDGAPINWSGLSRIFATDRKSSSLDDIADLIDWQPIAALLAPLYAASKGEAAWPPLTMFRAILLTVWHLSLGRQAG